MSICSAAVNTEVLLTYYASYIASVSFWCVYGV